MNTYEEKREARIERIKNRIQRLEKFAEGKDLSLFGESKSGIPLGQPILVGHHSERRHRRHLERINNLVKAGYDASKKAEQLKERLWSIENNKSIQVDNPQAKELIQKKIDNLEKTIEAMKAINKMIRQIMKSNNYESTSARIDALAEMIDSSPYKPRKYNSKEWACELIADNRFGGLGFRSFELTNRGTELRRLRKRLLEIDKINEGFEPFTINEIKVTLESGQVQIEFPKKPDEKSRAKIKQAGIAFKWSSYSKRWVRKYTASTGRYFFTELKKILQDITYE